MTEECGSFQLNISCGMWLGFRICMENAHVEVRLKLNLQGKVVGTQEFTELILLCITVSMRGKVWRALLD